MARVVAGIDAGLTNTGVVVLDDNYNILSLNLIQAEPSAAKRLVDIENAVSCVLKQHYEVVVFLEGYAYGAKYQRESLAELGGVLRRYFYLARIPYWVIPPLLLKSYVTGSPRANKNFMKKCTKEKWKEAFKSDDVCDAYGLARLGVTVSNQHNVYDIYEHRVVREILDHPGNYREPNTARRPLKRNVNRKNSVKS